MTKHARPTVPFARPEVAAVFEALPQAPCDKLLELRSLIFTTAAKTLGVGPIEEALRWGEPSYLTSHSKSGTTIRIHWKPRTPDHCAMYVHCQTNLLEQFRLRHGAALVFEGNRAVLFAVEGPLPERVLADCVQLALTYHQR